MNGMLLTTVDMRWTMRRAIGISVLTRGVHLAQCDLILLTKRMQVDGLSQDIVNGG